MRRDPPTTTRRLATIAPCMSGFSRWPVPSSVLFKPDLLADDLAEFLVGLCCLEAAVEVDRGLNIPVAEEPPHDLVGARMMAQIDGRCGMAKLVNGESQAGCVFNPVGNLTAEHVGCLRRTAHSRKQTVRRHSAPQRGHPP